MKGTMLAGWCTYRQQSAKVVNNVLLLYSSQLLCEIIFSQCRELQSFHYKVSNFIEIIAAVAYVHRRKAAFFEQINWNLHVARMCPNDPPKKPLPACKQSLQSVFLLYNNLLANWKAHFHKTLKTLQLHFRNKSFHFIHSPRYREFCLFKMWKKGHVWQKKHI